MSDTVLQIPLDFAESLHFRVLQRVLSPSAPEEGMRRAHFVYLQLWRFLGYKAQEGNSPGQMGEEDFQLLGEDLAAGGMTGREVLDLLVEPVKLLVRNGDGFVCPRFAMLNANLRPATRTQHQRGGDMRAFSRNMEKTKGRLLGDGLMIDNSRWVDAEGRAIDSDTVRRIQMLVIACDNALFKGERHTWMWSKELIQNALAVIEKCSEEQINSVCKTIVLRRGHALLANMNTEKLLPQFSEILPKLNN